MPPNETAMFRKACDALIQVQDTDVLSGSMLEHLYAGNAVVTGDWLPYGKLIAFGVLCRSLWTVKSIKEVPTWLRVALRYSEETTGLHRIYEFTSWKIVRDRGARLDRGGEP